MVKKLFGALVLLKFLVAGAYLTVAVKFDVLDRTTALEMIEGMKDLLPKE